jgi:Holliday junction resolvase
VANPSKRKGTSHEVAVVEFLKANGFEWAERRALAGVNDRGDIAGIPGVVIECKNEARIDLAGYVDELEVEKRNAGVTTGFVVVKRRNKSIERAYVVCELRDLPDLIR